MTNLFNSKIAYTLVLVLVSVISFMFSLSIHQPSSEPSISEINYKLLCQEIAGDPRDEQSGMIGNEDLSAVPGMKLSDFVEICEIAYEKNKGDLNTKHNLARAHMANNDYETAYDILIELSEQDYPQAKQTLREYNWNNNFPEVSYDMEMELLVQSARLGLPHAVGLAYSYWTRVNHTVEVEKRISRRELTDLLVSSANNSLNGYPSAIVYENYQEISEFIASDPTLSTNLREEHFYQEKAFYDGYINRSDIEIPKLEKWQVCYVLQNFAQKFIEPFAILGDNRETRIVERFHLAFNYDEFPEEFVDLLKENCTGLRTNKPQSASQYVVGLYSDFLVNGELNLAEILIELESMRDVEFYPDILSKLAPNVDLFVEEDEDQYLDFFIEEAENYFKSVGANTRFLIPWYHFLVEYGGLDELDVFQQIELFGELFVNYPEYTYPFFISLDDWSNALLRSKYTLESEIFDWRFKFEILCKPILKWDVVKLDYEFNLKHSTTEFMDFTSDIDQQTLYKFCDTNAAAHGGTVYALLDIINKDQNPVFNDMNFTGSPESKTLLKAAKHAIHLVRNLYDQIDYKQIQIVDDDYLYAYHYRIGLKTYLTSIRNYDLGAYFRHPSVLRYVFSLTNQVNPDMALRLLDRIERNNISSFKDFRSIKEQLIDANFGSLTGDIDVYERMETVTCKNAFDTNKSTFAKVTEKYNNFPWLFATFEIKSISDIDLKNSALSLDSEFDSRQVHADIMIGEFPDDCTIRFANQFGEQKLVNEYLLENNSTEITVPQFSSALQSPLVQNSNLYHEDWSIRYRLNFFNRTSFDLDELNLRPFPFIKEKITLPLWFPVGSEKYLTIDFIPTSFANVGDFNVEAAYLEESKLSKFGSELFLILNLEYSFSSMLLKIVLPVSILAFLSLSSLPEQRFDSDEAHLSLATSLVLAIVAYQFVVNTILPPLPYLTVLDYYIYSLFLCGSFAVISNVLFHIEFFNSRQRAFTVTVTVSNIISICCFLVGHALLLGAYTAVFL